MVATEHYPIHTFIDSLHHRERGRRASVQSCPDVQLLDQNIRAVPMPIRNNDFIRARFTGSADGGIYILSHLFAKTGVFGMAWRDLLPGCHTRNSFHVSRYQDFHDDSPCMLKLSSLETGVLLTIHLSTNLPTNG